MNSSGFLTGNLIIDLSISSWFIAQLIKLILELTLHRRFDIEKMWSSGGMPSSHSSFVCAAASSIGMIEGFDSSLFSLALIFAGVVMYDACHVRRSAGEQAMIINLLTETMKKKFKEADFGLKDIELKEILGHTPLQVMAGGILGVATGCFGVMHLGN